MKKIAYFFSAFLPTLITLAVQLLAMALMVGIAMLFLFPVIPSLRQNGVGFDTLTTLLTDTNFNTCIMLIYSVSCILLFGMWYYRSCGGNFLPKVTETFHPLQIASVFVLVPGLQFFSSYLTEIVSAMFPELLRQFEELEKMAGLDSHMSFITILYAVIFAPLCEELIFRGVTMRLFRRALPFWAANLLQAALFGLLHMNWIQGIYAFALGLALGILCEKGGSIYYSMLLHILFNFWGACISQFLGNHIEDTFPTAVMIFLVTIASLSIGSFLFFTGAKRKKQKRSSATSLNSRETFTRCTRNRDGSGEESL